MLIVGIVFDSSFLNLRCTAAATRRLPLSLKIVVFVEREWGSPNGPNGLVAFSSATTSAVVTF